MRPTSSECPPEKPPKAAEMGFSGHVTAATGFRFDVLGSASVMFSSSPGATGRKAGRSGARPQRKPNSLTSPRWLECAQQRPRISSVRSMCAGPEDQGPDLTGRSKTGKFDRVAPDRGREAEGGVRLIFENSTVC